MQLLKPSAVALLIGWRNQLKMFFKRLFNMRATFFIAAEVDGDKRLRHEDHRRRTKSQSTFLKLNRQSSNGWADFIFVIVVGGAIIFLLLGVSNQIWPTIRPEF